MKRRPLLRREEGNPSSLSREVEATVCEAVARFTCALSTVLSGGPRGRIGKSPSPSCRRLLRAAGLYPGSFICTEMQRSEAVSPGWHSL